MAGGSSREFSGDAFGTSPVDGWSDDRRGDSSEGPRERDDKVGGESRSVVPKTMFRRSTEGNIVPGGGRTAEPNANGAPVRWGWVPADLSMADGARIDEGWVAEMEDDARGGDAGRP